MKFLNLIIILFTFSNVILAQQYANLNFFSENGIDFQLSVDSVKQSDTGDSAYELKKLKNQSYKIEITFSNADTILRMTIFPEKGFETTYVIFQKREKFIIKLQKTLFIENEEEIITETDTANTKLNFSDTEINEKISVLNFDINNYKGTTNCEKSISDDDFLHALSYILSFDFEDDKLEIAKKIIQENCLNSNQIRHIIGNFDLEKTKLKFAEFAYQYVYDLDNYHLIETALLLTSVEELRKFKKSQ